MSEVTNKRGIKTVFRKIIKGKSMKAEAIGETLLIDTAVKKQSLPFKIVDANEDEIPFGWKNDVSFPKKGRKHSIRLSKKVLAQIKPRTKKDN